MGFIQRRLVKGVMWVVTWPKVTVAVCAVVLVAAGAFAWFHLRLSTDQDELLTPKLKFFRDYKQFTARFPENEAFVVILEPRDYRRPPPARRWIAFADRISDGLLALKGDVKHVSARVPLKELGDQALLFAEWDEVKAQSGQMKEFVQLVRVLGEAPGLDALVLGRNMTARFFNALARGPAKDSKELVEVVGRSLAAAVRRPPEQWRRGEEIPSLAELDPRAATDPSQAGYNMIPDETKRGEPERYRNEKILVINVYAERDYSSLADVTEPLARMRAAVATAAADFPEFLPPVITGRPALEADEMATSDHDTRVAEICGLSLVFVVLYLFLRNLWLVIVAEVCLGVGIGWTFGWATLSVGRLNLLSLVFVIALIGIGMDYLIQILTRYRFEKRRYTRPRAIWARVFRYVSAPISTACLGAGGAFLVSALTDFSGAAELGIIAGGGLLLCLLAGYTLLPALLTLFPAGVGKVHVSRRYRLHGRHPRAGGVRLLPALAWVGVAAAGLWVALPPQFDANLLRLQADHLPSVKAVRKLPTWYAVVLSDDLDKLRKAREALQPGPDSTVGKTESVLEAMDKQGWLAGENGPLLNIRWQDPAPPTVADLNGIVEAAQGMVGAWGRQADAGDLSGVKEAVQALVAELRGGEGDAARATQIERVAAWQRAFLGEIRANLALFSPGLLEVGRLPASLREHLVSDRYAPRGEASRPAPPLYALYVYPKADLWETGELRNFVVELERRTPEDVTLTGIAPQLFHSTQEIHRAFMVATIYALALIVLLVLLDLRKLTHTLLAISVLALGLPMLLLAMWVWRTVLHEPLGIPGSWNFANFFGLPILIGAGHEYGVFMVHRYRETLHDPRRVWRTWDVSDRALLLCGIVTSASFGFLIAAKHHGLASLGWVMCVGTACIYLATLLVLRPILQWRLKQKGVYEPHVRTAQISGK
jgi:predicted RND superfamily exporter protein